MKSTADPYSFLRFILFGFALFLVSCGGEEEQDTSPVAGKPFVIPSVGNLEMLWCPPGTFRMGGPEGEVKTLSFDEHRRTVTLTNGFWLGKHEVTQAQWEKVMGRNPSLFKGPNHPVEQVSWVEAMVFCDELMKLERAAGRVPEGWVYQLPSEAQWEYACRAGTQTKYAFGDKLTLKQARFESDSFLGKLRIGTAEVGQYPANAWGFHDMHGNVAEWCWEFYDRYIGDVVTDPLENRLGYSRPLSILRGGGWDYKRSKLRSAARGGHYPSMSDESMGFRLSLSREREQGDKAVEQARSEFQLRFRSTYPDLVPPIQTPLSPPDGPPAPLDGPPAPPVPLVPTAPSSP